MDAAETIASVPTDFIVGISFVLIAVSFVIIVIAVVIYAVKNRKGEEEKRIEHVLRHVEMIKTGTAWPAEKKGGKGAPSASDVSIKEMLVKKFKPKIESQIGSKVEVIDFKAADSSKNFVAHVEISGVKLSVVLDDSGKIIDYRKEK